MEYYSVIKNNKIMLFVATWMDLEVVILSEGSQTEKHKYRISLICEKRKETNELIYRHRLTDIENKLIVTKGEMKGLGG